MPREAILPVAITLLAVLLGCAAVLIGWRNLKARQAGVPEPYAPFEDTISHRFEGMYVATTRFEDWLDRIAVHELGVRSNATLQLGEHGLHLIRPGTRDVHIPWSKFDRVMRSSGMIGKFVERDGLIVVSWEKDGFAFDTGFRPRYAEETPMIYQLLASHHGGQAEQETNK